MLGISVIKPFVKLTVSLGHRESRRILFVDGGQANESFFTRNFLWWFGFANEMVVNRYVGNIFGAASRHVATYAIRLSSDSCLGAQVLIRIRVAGIASIVKNLFPRNFYAHVRIMARDAR